MTDESFSWLEEFISQGKADEENEKWSIVKRGSGQSDVLMGQVR